MKCIRCMRDPRQSAGVLVASPSKTQPWLARRPTTGFCRSSEYGRDFLLLKKRNTLYKMGEIHMKLPWLIQRPTTQKLWMQPQFFLVLKNSTRKNPINTVFKMREIHLRLPRRLIRCFKQRCDCECKFFCTIKPTSGIWLRSGFFTIWNHVAGFFGRLLRRKIKLNCLRRMSLCHCSTQRKNIRF